MRTAIGKLMLENGYKMTEQRQKIIDILIANLDRHLSIEDIYYYAKKKDINLATPTIYRTMRVLESIDVVVKNSFGESAGKYELYIKEKKNHHHLICKECNRIVEISGAMLDDLCENIFIETGFECEEKVLKIYGYCDDCRKRRMSYRKE